MCARLAKVVACAGNYKRQKLQAVEATKNRSYKQQTGLEDPSKKSVLVMGLMLYDLSKFDRRPLGGCLVIFTPFCKIDTGNDSIG